MANSGEQRVRNAFFSIARCENVGRCLGRDSTSPCAEIVRSQGTSDSSQFQLPEPWVGRIDVAPILFVASNPSIGEDDHATSDLSDDVLWESHYLAFGGGSRAYIVDGTKTTRDDGSVIKAVRYWSAIKARAAELLPHRQVRPGIDYAMTEVVHCKSKNEVGVSAAVQTCVDLHLDSVLEVSGALVVVAMGAFAKRWIFSDGGPAVQRRTLGGKERLVAWLPHPAGFRGPKTFAKALSIDDLLVLRTVLQEGL